MKNIADDVLLPIGFYFIESRNDIHMYAHERAPVFAHAFCGGGKIDANCLIKCQMVYFQKWSQKLYWIEI